MPAFISPQPSSLSSQFLPQIVLLVSLELLACGCRQDRSSADKFSLPGDGSKRPLIRLQLNWLPDPQFGGFYAARILGEYDRVGLSVEIIAGGPGSQPIPRVAMGQIEFGVGNADQVLLARQEEAPIVAVMAAMQQSPRCLIVHESSGIRSFDDLRDITIALGEGNAFVKVMQSKVPLPGVRIVSYSGNVAKFVQDQNYAQQGYVFSEPIVARKQGSDPYVLMLSEIGFNPYTGVVVANEKFIAENPELVKKFVLATIRGWQAYLRDPTKVNAELARLNPDMDVSILDEAMEVIRPLCLPDGFSEQDLGKMDGARWEELAKLLRDVELLRVEPTDVSQAYRLDFVDVDAESRAALENP